MSTNWMDACFAVRPHVPPDSSAATDAMRPAPVSGPDVFEILIVDDSPFQRALLTQILRDCGYVVNEAKDGAEAFRLVQQRNIRIVFTDWMMPNMSGVDFIQKLRKENPGPYIYAILCSSKDSRTDVIDGIRSGADDFLLKPAMKDELLARLHAGERVIALENRLAREKEELTRAHASLSQAHEILRSDLQAASNLQLSLLPKPAQFQGISFDWVFRPASDVAGDIFNVFPLDQDHIAFYQLDVSGHGIPSSMFSFSLSKVIQSAPLHDSLLKRRTNELPFYRIVPPNQVASELNDTFQNENDMYFTLVYGILNIKTGVLQFTQAGHPHPILAKADGTIRLLGNTGFPVAAWPKAEFELVNEFLHPGDRLILGSDGLTECFNSAKEQFGMERMVNCLKGTARLPLAGAMGSIIDGLLSWRGRDQFDDDISLLAIEYASPSSAQPNTGSAV